MSFERETRIKADGMIILPPEYRNGDGNVWLEGENGIRWPKGEQKFDRFDGIRYGLDTPRPKGLEGFREKLDREIAPEEIANDGIRDVVHKLNNRQ